MIHPTNSGQLVRSGRIDGVELAVPARRQSHREVLQLAHVIVDCRRFGVCLHHGDRAGEMATAFEEVTQAVVDVTHDPSARA